ncbi:MAG: MFS transporter [Chlamydiia bacterium]|nr:MFS transporter [Chlamydiia bacterium]
MKTFWPSLGICLGIFVVAMDWSIVNNALPSIQRDLGATLGELQWIINAFGLGMAATMVTFGRFADAYGRRRFFFIGLVICALSSIGAALSPSAAWLITFRTFQGLSNAMVITTSQSLITHVFPEEQHGKALGIWSAIVGVGLALGPVLGGIIIAMASWHWIFYFNLPFLLISWILVKGFVQESKNEEQDTKIDIPGLLLLVGGIGGFVMGVIQGPDWGWKSPLIVGLFVFAAICLVLFYYIEHRISSPLIQFKFFKKKNFAAACIGNFCVIFLFWGIFFSIPLYLQTVLSYTPFVSGMFILAISLPFTVASHFVGPIADKLNKKYIVMFGFFLALIGLVIMSTFTDTQNSLMVLLALVFFGLGTGSSFPASASLGVSTIPRNFVGVATGVLATVQEIGGTVGLSFVGAVIRTIEKSKLHDTLNRHGIVLSTAMEKKVRSLLSSYQELQNYLSHMSTQVHEQILGAFRDSFMVGYRGAMWLLIAISVFAILSIFIIAKRAKNDSNSEAE